MNHVPRHGRLSFAQLALLAVLVPAAHAQDTRNVSEPMVTAILAAPLATPADGAAKASVTVVEYFDYECPVCRQLEPSLHQLLAQRPGVRLIRKDWPIFGEASEYAAYCSFAAARIGKYQAAHDALIASHRDLDSKTAVRAVLREAGFDARQLDRDIEAHQRTYAGILARNRDEAKSLGLHGTPGILVAHQVLLGHVDLAGLKRLVDQAAH